MGDPLDGALRGPVGSNASNRAITEAGRERHARDVT